MGKYGYVILAIVFAGAAMGQGADNKRGASGFATAAGLCILSYATTRRSPS